MPADQGGGNAPVSISPYQQAVRRLHRYYDDRLVEQLQVKRLLGQLFGYLQVFVGAVFFLPLVLAAAVAVTDLFLANVVPEFSAELLSFVGSLAVGVGPGGGTGPAFTATVGDETVVVVQNASFVALNGTDGADSGRALVVSQTRPTPSPTSCGFPRSSPPVSWARP